MGPVAYIPCHPTLTHPRRAGLFYSHPNSQDKRQGRWSPSSYQSQKSYAMYFCSALTAVITLGAVHSALALPVQGPPGFGPWDGAVGVPVAPGIPIPPANIPGPPLHGDEQVLVTVEENLSHLSAHLAYHPNDDQYTPYQETVPSLISVPVKVGPMHAGPEMFEDQLLIEENRAIDVEGPFARGLMKRDIGEADDKLPPGTTHQNQLHTRGSTKITATLTGEGRRQPTLVQSAARNSVEDLLNAKKLELNIVGDLEVTVEGTFKCSTTSADVPFKFSVGGKKYTGVARGQGEGEITRKRS
ncbi:uncharacterized protein C8R40DRAFT_239041 [Lentinula edodes]|uniref:uncharacterized protein n=1 Tax=Lentinula edodes TaxID=5353 RepID=UPI001E8EE6F5|nr:uncharacterized protein C8R40DRAFT_239041 [Lentinula edodes]KAH7874986.1 hypothetical protein C8R40DRAFT_239041 [Lentinula edodes]